MESNKTKEQMSNDSLWVRLRDFVKGYFDLSSDLDDEKMAEEAVMDGVSFKGANIIILILAIFIASLVNFSISLFFKSLVVIVFILSLFINFCSGASISLIPNITVFSFLK